jgi:hypothetical protein
VEVEVCQEKMEAFLEMKEPLAEEMARVGTNPED